jgi:MFS family permease
MLYTVALVVLIVDRTGSATLIAVVTAFRIGAYVVVGPFAGAIADRFPRRGFLIALDLARFVVFLVAAAFIAVQGPLVVVIALTVLAAVLSVPYRAAAAAATPHLVPEDDLAAANAAESATLQLAFFVGPALGTLVLAVSGPAEAFVANALSFLVAALMVLRAGSLGGRATGADEDTPSLVGVWRDTVDGARTVRRSTVLIALFVLSGLTYLQMGAERISHVLVAEDVLDRPADFVGMMYAAMAVGGILVAPFGARIAATRRSAETLVGSCIALGVGAALLGVVPAVPLSMLVLVLMGVAGMVLEVLFITLLQRSTTEQTLSRVFGLNDSVSALTEVIGASLFPLSVALAGIGWSLGTLGVLIVAVSVATLPALRREAAQQRAAVERLAPLVAELQGYPLFEGATRAALERLARSMRLRVFTAGDPVVVEGDAAEHLYLVRSGSFEVASVAAGPLAMMAAGDFFGEIGLMRRVPRTASVACAVDGEAWEIDGEVFVAALAGPLPGRELVEATVTARQGPAAG